MVKFTEDEQNFIDHCFDSTLAHFVKDPLNRDNEDHIRQAINYRNYNIGSIGVRNHELMHSIFDKMGFCKDGKTTQDEAFKREVALEQEKVEIWSKQRDLAISECDQKIAVLQGIKRELLGHDKKFNEVVKEKAEIAQNKFKEEMKEERTESRNMLIRESTEEIDNMNVRQLREVAKKRGVKNYSRLNKAEMQQAIKEA